MSNRTASPRSSVRSHSQAGKFTREVQAALGIYRMKADGTKVTQLTNGPAQAAYPDWQPTVGGSEDDE